MSKTVGSLLSEAAFYADGAKRFAIASSIRLDEAGALKPDLANDATLSTSVHNLAAGLVEDLSVHSDFLQHLADAFGHHEVRCGFDSGREEP